MKHLTIISHTEHYLNADGLIVGLGSTVTEINHLLALFDRITHVAMLHDVEAPPNALPYASERIEFISIPAVGGPAFRDKVSIIRTIPRILKIIHTQLKQTDCFQFRAPTGIGVFIIPYLIFFTSKKGWFKYAGNWNQTKAPLSYCFQKWLLEQQSRKVTINGIWNSQPPHCLSFENPCLTQEEFYNRRIIRSQRTFNDPINFCFVGRLESAKGVDLLIDAFRCLETSLSSRIGTIHLVGTGDDISFYKEKVSNSPLNFVFHGLLSRHDVHAIYKVSHAILLPSASEGFPKVIAEAMNYGCIPIVSNVSALGQLIRTGHNGFLMDAVTVQCLSECLTTFFDLDASDYMNMIAAHDAFSEKFTYDYYITQLMEQVL